MAGGASSAGPVSHDPVSHGPVSHGPVSHRGLVSHRGPMSHGLMSHEPVSHRGPMSHRLMSHEPVSHQHVSSVASDASPDCLCRIVSHHIASCRQRVSHGRQLRSRSSPAVGQGDAPAGRQDLRADRTPEIRPPARISGRRMAHRDSNTFARKTRARSESCRSDPASEKYVHPHAFPRASPLCCPVGGRSADSPWQVACQPDQKTGYRSEMRVARAWAGRRPSAGAARRRRGPSRPGFRSADRGAGSSSRAARGSSGARCP